jgi:hypothetical protein
MHPCYGRKIVTERFRDVCLGWGLRNAMTHGFVAMSEREFLVAASSAKKTPGLGVPAWHRAGAPYGNRTRVSAVKGRRPRPLDEGRLEARRHIEAFARCGKEAA